MIIIVDVLNRMAGWLNRGLGSRGERVAAGYLKRSGYRVLGRNLRNRFGEVDILAEAPDRRTIVVIEVKSGIPPHREASTRNELARISHQDFVNKASRKFAQGWLGWYGVYDVVCKRLFETNRFEGIGRPGQA